MQINIKKLSNSFSSLTNNVNDYNRILNDYYFEMNNASSLSNSKIAQEFFSAVKEEKYKNIIFYNELLSLKNIYSYVYNQYGNLGDFLSFDLSKKDFLLERIQSVKEKLYDVKNKLYYIDTYNCPEINPLINDTITYIDSTIESINNWEREMNNKINLIEKTERAVSEKLSGITIDKITETDITPFM